MKRRDFLKIGAATVAAGTVTMSATAGTKATAPVAATNTAAARPVPGEDWSVKFRSVKASIARETYEVFYKEGQQSHNPAEFLAYLLSGTDLPRCETVDGMTTRDGYENFMSVTFTGVVFASNTRRHAANRFAGFEHTGFCMYSPDSQSGMHLSFSEEVA